MIQRPENLYSQYHAHVYFDEESLERARSLCEEAGKVLGVSVGRVHTRLVGPHPHWSCQLSFDSSQFEQVIDWLEQNRGGLNILVHGVTGNDLEDHTIHASWLGSPSRLNLEFFIDKGVGD